MTAESSAITKPASASPGWSAVTTPRTTTTIGRGGQVVRKVEIIIIQNSTFDDHAVVATMPSTKSAQHPSASCRDRPPPRRDDRVRCALDDVVLTLCTPTGS